MLKNKVFQITFRDGLNDQKMILVPTFCDETWINYFKSRYPDYSMISKYFDLNKLKHDLATLSKVMYREYRISSYCFMGDMIIGYDPVQKDYTLATKSQYNQNAAMYYGILLAMKPRWKNKQKKRTRKKARKTLKVD